MSLFASFVIPLKDDWSDAVRNGSKAFAILLQILYTFVSVWIATAWIVSVAPFIPASSLAILPAFVWPNPAPAIRRWIVDFDGAVLNRTALNGTALNETWPWAVCGGAPSLSSLYFNRTALTSLELTPPPTLLPPSNSTQPSTLVEKASSFLSAKFCLTDGAAYIYNVCVAMSFVLFFYHLFMVIYWPRIYRKWEADETPSARRAAVVERKALTEVVIQMAKDEAAKKAVEEAA